MRSSNPPARIRIHANERPGRKVPLTSNVTPERLADAQQWAEVCVDVIERYVADVNRLAADSENPVKRESLAQSYEEVLHFLTEGKALWDDLGAALDQGVTVICWGESRTSHLAVLLDSLERIKATLSGAGLGFVLIKGYDLSAAVWHLIGKLALPKPRAYVGTVLAELSRAATGRTVAAHAVTLEAEPVLASTKGEAKKLKGLPAAALAHIPVRKPGTADGIILKNLAAKLRKKRWDFKNTTLSRHTMSLLMKDYGVKNDHDGRGYYRLPD